MPLPQDGLEERFARGVSFEEQGDPHARDVDGHEDDEDDGAYDDGSGHDEEEDDDDEDGREAYDDGHGSYEEHDELGMRRSSSAGSSLYDPQQPLTYSESAEIMSKKYMERDQVKMSMELQEREKRLQKQRYRKQQIEKWQHKTSKSPFRVNLVAENERLDEENRLRIMEDARRARELARRAEKAKQEVILKALTESSDLELLRREKRAIIDEEKRLKALMDLEKTNSHRKLDLIAAKNAEKRRRQEKEEFRRRQRQEELELRERRYKQLLKEKLAIEG